jgi:hypothetical protein
MSKGRTRVVQSEGSQHKLNAEQMLEGHTQTAHKRDEDVKAGGTDTAVLLGFISSSSGLILMCFLSDEQNVCVSDSTKVTNAGRY